MVSFLHLESILLQNNIRLKKVVHVELHIHMNDLLYACSTTVNNKIAFIIVFQY